MEEDFKYVAQNICGECGEGSVHGDHFWKPISLFADDSNRWNPQYPQKWDNTYFKNLSEEYELVKVTAEDTNTTYIQNGENIKLLIDFFLVNMYMVYWLETLTQSATAKDHVIVYPDKIK
jgi:hypothetical protein